MNRENFGPLRRTPSMKPNARVRAMAERRTVILKTAERLIRSERSTCFSMRQLATEAGFSTATTYNLIGSKATVLYSILARTMETLLTQKAKVTMRDDPVALLLEYGIIPINFFIDDSDLLKPLFQHLLGVPDRDHHPQFMDMVLDYWIDACTQVGELAPLRAPLTVLDSARILQFFAVGALELWVHEELDDDQLSEEIRRGMAGFAAAFWELQDVSGASRLLVCRQRPVASITRD